MKADVLATVIFLVLGLLAGLLLMPNAWLFGDGIELLAIVTAAQALRTRPIQTDYVVLFGVLIGLAVLLIVFMSIH